MTIVERDGGNSVVTEFAELFQGRTDAYGSDDGGCVRVMWQNEPCQRSWLDCPAMNLWNMHLAGEAIGGPWPKSDSIGVYPVTQQPMVNRIGPNFGQQWFVRWGCVDLDIRAENHPTFDYETEQEAHDAAVTLQRVLRRVGITGWIERTRSHGRHVWVFADGWVPARDMRRALLVACDVAEVPTREVNPKQESLGEGQLGNYVRLGYPGALNEWQGLGVAGGVVGRRGSLLPRAEAERVLSECLAPDDGQGRSRTRCVRCGSRWLDPHRPSVAAPEPFGLRGEGHVPLASAEPARRSGADDDVVLAHGRAEASEDSGVPRRVAIATDQAPLCITCFVAAALQMRSTPDVYASLAQLYVVPSQPRKITRPTTTRSTTPEYTSYVQKMVDEGPLDGTDRSTFLARLAHKCFESGMDEELALQALYEADDLVGKFVGRRDRDSRLQDMIRSAYDA